MLNTTPNTTPAQDQLLLSLAHGPLSPELLSSLVSVTATRCQELSQAMRLEGGVTTTKQSSSTPTQRLFLTGSSHVIRPGREFEDWETLWTPGEDVMNRVVHRIGLDKFHRVGKDLKLMGHLVDIVRSDTLKENQRLENHNWETTLREDLAMTTSRVLSQLKLNRAAPLAKATVVVPIEEIYAKVDQEQLKSVIESVLHVKWVQVDGPLKGADVSVELVF